MELLPCEDERAEAMAVAQRVRAALDRGVAPEEIAVFYRIHAQSRPLEEALRAARVAYRIVGGLRFYDRAEVKDLLAYLRLALNPDDDVQLLRVLNVPARKLGKTTVDRWWPTHRRRRSLWKLIAANDLPPEVAGAARKAFAGFYQLVELMRQRQSQRADQPADFAAWVYAHTGYKAMLDADGSPEAEARRENVAELLGSVMAYQSEDEAPTLAGYLQRVTLNEETPSEPDATGQPPAGRVSLMSVHSAKGLEFDAVFLTGLEDGMFPYKGTEVGADAGELEEERRLAYVAITRARKQLALSYARFRQLFGQTKIHPPSRFLFEIPPELLSQPVPRRALDRALAPHLGAAARHAAQRPPASAAPAPSPGAAGGSS
jgi:DNA helicase-2/ATP-dependent DNA helicase PcrA